MAREAASDSRNSSRFSSVKNFLIRSLRLPDLSLKSVLRQRSRNSAHRNCVSVSYTHLITVSDILKNNDTHLDGLTILAPGQHLAPTLYLDYYYGQYERGRSFSDITDDILTAYRENRPKSPVDISFFTDYDKVKSRVTMKLINYERNRELLKRVPYYRFLDLAIVFLCLVCLLYTSRCV